MATGTTTTPRLVLSPPVQGDLAELHALHADPGVWAHFPAGRHATVEATERILTDTIAGWEERGLDFWTVRTRLDEGPGALVGMGGCRLHRGPVWNLYYRLSPTVWGRGMAQELIAAARSAATTQHPEVPVAAYLLEHNDRSRRAAERAGLQQLWRGPDVGNPDPEAVRLVYADREVDVGMLGVVTGQA
ncbi:GNAT family N-acetyltransferase [Actinotalea sp. C106]|uniref:GNAT family N-acetyltransferase n=1 Tax=Actinotalea sp. C106 TaxID=2908644 RepID=UPI0020288DCC|nr:GNAT family N-acetyltransferase [Actinotalea sp. C106]